MLNVLPLFQIDYGFESILTVDPVKTSPATKRKDFVIKDTEPVSILKIAVQHNIDPTYVVSPNFTPYWQLYKNFKEIDRQFVFVWKVAIVSDASQKNEESSDSESNVLICLKNKESYYKIVKWVTRANIDNFYYRSRIDWKTLQEFYDPALFEILVPFYSSFIARNLTRYGAICQPNWGNIKPIFLIQQQGLLIDSFLKEKVENYCKINNIPYLPAHQCYYYKEEDAETFQAYKCIQGRSTLYDPDLRGFCSTGFSFESYLKYEHPQLVA